MSSLANPLLVTGYVLAVPLTLFTPGFLRMWRRREPAVFAVHEVGVGLIVGVLATKGAVAGTLINGSWLVGFTAAYCLEGRKRAQAGRA
jgi:hypothetical protein